VHLLLLLLLLLLLQREVLKVYPAVESSLSPEVLAQLKGWPGEEGTTCCCCDAAFKPLCASCFALLLGSSSQCNHVDDRCPVLSILHRCGRMLTIAYSCVMPGRGLLPACSHGEAHLRELLRCGHPEGHVEQCCPHR
jgi:hypothetical protein